MTAVVRVNRAELARVAALPGVGAALRDVGDQVAERAAAAAPKDSGEGARSIRAELSDDRGLPVVRVSWDRAHFYMLFHEVGTSRKSARPFLRPALDAQFTL